MIPAGYLISVICSCINVTYAPRESRAQNQTSQSCSRPAAAVSAFARRRLLYGAGQRPLAAPGLSLSATSSASEAAASGQRYQSRFYREAFSQIGKASSDSCPGDRFVLERVREPGVIGAANAETRAWLSGVPSAASFSSNIYLIVCCRISWNRFISYWSPTMPARLAVMWAIASHDGRSIGFRNHCKSCAGLCKFSANASSFLLTEPERTPQLKNVEGAGVPAPTRDPMRPDYRTPISNSMVS